MCVCVCAHSPIRQRHREESKVFMCLCLVVTQQQIAISYNNHACTCDKCAEEGNIGTAVFIVSWQAHTHNRDRQLPSVVGAHRSFWSQQTLRIMMRATYFLRAKPKASLTKSRDDIEIWFTIFFFFSFSHAQAAHLYIWRLPVFI